jgi:branched-chain amino acid aminotransferase
MVQLQKPKWVYMGGTLRPWEQAVLHISTEAITRGLNVFEGLKGYWQQNGCDFGIVAMPRHFARLQRSAKLLHIPCEVTYGEFEAACHKLVRALYNHERDMWVRATLFVIDGHWGEGTVSDLVLTAYHHDKARPKPISVGISTWQRASDINLPPRIKTGSNYEIGRLARIEGRRQGHSEMILLNQWGRVSEGTGSCLLMVRDGKVVTPPASEGRLESITVEIVAAICRSLGIEFVERPIDRTELYIAEELALAGTLAELVPVSQIDAYPLSPHQPIMERIAARFWGAARGIDPHPAFDLSMIRERVPA